MKTLITIILSILTIAIWSILIVKSVKFNQNCGGYLKRAADANTVEMASKELSIAVDYIEKNHLTSGYTSILWETPDEDISFWYNNIRTAKSELDSLPSNSSSMEKSNMLIKLRETLLDTGDKGSTNVTVPDGISKYPSNGLWALAFILSIVFLIVIAAIWIDEL